MTGFGVHLGNSSVCLAQSKDGKTDVIANNLGDRVTPAVISHDGNDYEICNAAKTGLRSRTFISNNKRLFDESISDELIEAINAKTDWKLSADNDSYVYQLKINNKTITITPEEVATKFYKEMHTIASHNTESDELQVVLAVPQDWTEDSRDKLCSAAEDAGFNVLQIINEPAAAVLAYDNWNYNECRNVLVYRVGGSSCDISVVNVSGGLYTVLKHTRENNVGGHRITKQLADYIAKEFHQRWKLDPNENKRAMDKLFQNASASKHVLSSLTSAHVFIESLYEGIDWSQNVSRARFENLIVPNLESYLAPLNRLLAETDFVQTIDTIVFCGGTMKIPKLQSAIASKFPNAQVLSGISPDEVIAIGCAKQASLLLEYSDEEPRQSTAEFNCITKGIYARYNDDKIDLFGSGSPNFAETKVPFKRCADSEQIHIRLFEEDDDTPLADYTFTSSSNYPNLHAVLNENQLTVNIA